MLVTYIKRQNRWLLVAFGAAVLFLLFYLLYIVIFGLDNGLVFNGYAADGSFQIYNPLRRLEAGQVIGRDFQFFHGIGIPLLFFLPFKLLGANIFANEVCKWLIPVSFFLVTAFSFFVITLRSWMKATIALALFVIVLIPLADDLVAPGNSLLGLRSSMPIVVAGLIALTCNRQLRFRKFKVPIKQLLIVLALSLAFFMSTENGLYAIFAYLLVQSVLAWKSKDGGFSKQLGGLALELIAVCLLIMVLFTIATHGHPLAPLTYALRTIPSAQFWYFGGPPNTFLDWHNLAYFALLSAKVFFFVCATVWIYILSLRMKLMTHEDSNAYLFLGVYGLVSCVTLLGYANVIQLSPLMKSLLAILAVLGIKLFIYYAVKFKKTSRPYYKRTVVSMVFCVSVLVMLISSLHYFNKISPYHYVDSLRAIRSARHSRDGAFATSATGWESALAAFPELDSARQGELWSTYTSLYESNRGILNPSVGGFDYIIHALGRDNFNTYVQQFTKVKPHYVITMKPDYFLYEQWLWTSNWQFYRQLLTNYVIIKQNTSHYLWEYRGSHAVNTEQSHNLTVARNSVTLPSGSSGLDPTLLELTLTYKATTQFNLLHALPRYLLKTKDTGLQYDISLPSDETQQVFVVPIFPDNKKPELTAYTDGLLPFAHLKINSATYRILQTDHANLAPFEINHGLCHYTDSHIYTRYVPCIKVPKGSS